MSFASIFFQSVDCPLILLTVFYRAVFNSVKSSLSIISFIDYAFGVVSKMPSSYLRSSRFSPMLSFRNVIVLHFTCKSIIYFELIFVKGIKSV